MPATLDTNFVVPSLDEIIARISGDMQSQLSGIDPYIPGSDEWVYARVLAGASFLQNGFLQSILRELFVGSATEINLPRIGSIWGIIRNEPTKSHYTIELTATDPTTVPIETLLTNIDGVEFLTDSEVVFAAAGTGSVDVTSVETGVSNNLDVGATLTFTVAIPDLEVETEVTAVIEDASDIEELSDYRNRILDRIQHMPQGGALADYELWTLDVDGVARCWVDSPGLGEVRVVFDGTPSAGTVQTALDEVRPVTAIVTAIKGTEYPIALDIDVKKISGYSNEDVYDAIVASLEGLFSTDGEPSATIYNSELRQAVSNAVGVDYFVLNNVIVDGVATGSPNSNVTTSATKFHTLDEATQELSVTWL